MTHARNYHAQRTLLEDLYERLNRRDFVHPDPIEFLYRYDDVADREIAGLIASSLAYGNVRSILRSVTSVLENMGPPHSFVMTSSDETFETVFSSFKHRFTTGRELAELLTSIQRVLREHGSLDRCFRSGLINGDNSVLSALSYVVHALNPKGAFNSLLPCPERGSACKRLHLYLRWMVRHDAVDPGGWTCIVPAQLIVPLDVHMFRIARSLGFTTRKTADLKAAVEITEAFRVLSPDDPLRYDFSLTRLGIRPDLSFEQFRDGWRRTSR
jgi:uncharacterized protein (TIGR02757 family)